MDKQTGRIRRILLLLFTFFVCVDFARGEEKRKVLVHLEEEEDSEDSVIVVRKDPSDFGGSERDPIRKTNQVIRLGLSEGSECPHSCFCEVEDSYASCIGDGQWNPPLLPNSLTRLELRSFYLPELESSSVRLPGLQELQLQQCNLSRLHQDAFLMVTELDRLDLSQNLLEVLGPNQLRGLSALRHLDLSSNNLSNLSRPFTHLTALEHLNLRNNKLKKLDADTFDGLDKVQYVNLDGNIIAIVNVAAFQHLGSLAHLILSNNPLSNLARLNFFGSRLQYIDVSNIGIEKVPQALTQFVRDLRLAKNNVREIHRGDLDSYPYLGLLVLDDNGLEILEEDALGRHEYLVRLWLNGNKLKTIPQSLPISLKALYIEENLISTLNNGDFSGLSNLEQIFMQRNHISSIFKCAFCDLLHLKTLDLQANNITNISESIFDKLSKLETLDLSQNPILTLNSESFKGLGYVRVLQISRVHTDITISENILDPLKSLQILEMYGSPSLVEVIVNSSRALHSLRGVRELNLMHNELTSLRNDFFSFFPKLSLIKLSGNSWDCSNEENILWLKNWMQNSPINFYRSFSVRCSNPPSLGFKPVLLLEEDDFDHGPTSTISSILVTLPLPSTTRGLPFSHIQGSRGLAVNFTNRESTSDKVRSTFSPLSPTLNNGTVTTTSAAPSTNVFSAFQNKNENSSTSEIYLKTKILSTQSYTTGENYFYDEVVESWPKEIKPSSSVDVKISILSTEMPLDSSTLLSNLVQNITKKTTENNTSVLPTTTETHHMPNPRPKTNSKEINETNKHSTNLSPKKSFDHNEVSKVKKPWKLPRPANKSHPTSEYRKDLWLYRGDASHSYVEHRKGVSVHSLHKQDNAVIVGAGIVSACIGIALILGGFVLARGISKKHRRLNVWENSRSSYWNGREGDEGEFISEGVVVGIGETGTGIMRETEGTVGVVTESHHGLNNRLYLLLQRDSSTGITPETLPDPTVSSAPNIISSENLSSNSRLFM